MAALIFLLIFCQAFGAVIGAFAALWAEVAYIIAMRDGKIDAGERAHLRAISKGLFHYPAR